MAKEKKAFAWDNEVTLKEIEVSAYEKRIVSITELKGKQYVCVATHKKIKDEWKPIKNATFTMDVWEQVADVVTDFKLGNAFGSDSVLEAPPKTPKKLTRKETDKAIEKALKGKKLSVYEQLKKNEYWGELTYKQQSTLKQDVEKMVEEWGTVGIVISKSNFAIHGGDTKATAEKVLKDRKGFSRAKFTFIAE